LDADHRPGAGPATAFGPAAAPDQGPPARGHRAAAFGSLAAEPQRHHASRVCAARPLSRAPTGSQQRLGRAPARRDGRAPPGPAQDHAGERREASAAYHAAHRLRPARPASEPGPKVVVERPSQATAVSPERPVPTVPSRAQAAGSREALSTFVPGRVLRRRVAMAILAGVLIV